MGKQLSTSTAKGYKGEQFVRSWAAEMDCVNFCPDVTAPSVDGMIQLYDERSGANFYLLFQAKCGNSYLQKKAKADSKYILLKLDRDDIANWQHARYPVIIIWVSDHPLGKRYALWTEAGRARRGSAQIRISKRSLLDSKAFPQLLEFAKTYAGVPSFPKLVGQPLFPSRVSSVKAAARKFYLDWRNEGCISPVFGKTEITLKAWRHITRASSSQRSVCHKLSLLPFAREILANGTKARFLRLLKEDVKKVRQTYQVQDNDAPLIYSFPAKETSRRELYALCGIYRSSYRSNLIVEVVVEVLRVNNNIVRTTLYGVHEQTK